MNPTVALLSVLLGSHFQGVGPQFGFDANYHVANHFGLVGHVATSLYVGRLEQDQSIIADPVPQVPGNEMQLTVNHDRDPRVVPALTSSLGIDFTHAVNNAMLNIELGYQFDEFFDVISSARTSSQGNFSNIASSIGFDGPYLRLSLKV